MIDICHEMYNKISDRIMWLSNEWMLKFNVELNRYSKNGDSKDNYHKEYGYNKNDIFGISISRDFNYYLSIETIKRDYSGRKSSVRIGIYEIIFFQQKLRQVVDWFTSESHKGMFARHNGKIIIVNRPDPIKVVLAFDSYIEFVPAIVEHVNGTQIIGVQWYINSSTSGFFIDVNRLLSLKYFIDTFNMYQSAQLMINYLGRPDYGTNLIDLSSNSSDQQSDGFFNRTKSSKKEN